MGVIRSLACRDLRPFAGALGLCVLIGTGAVAHSVPSLLYQRSHGPNDEVAQRTAAESDYYALRPIQLISPVPGHRIPALANITRETLEAPNNSEGTSYLGMIGSVGFLTLIASALIASSVRPPADSLLTALAVPVLTAVLLGVTGGFSWVIALGGFTEIRSWNRLSVLIGFQLHGHGIGGRSGLGPSQTGRREADRRALAGFDARRHRSL